MTKSAEDNSIEVTSKRSHKKQVRRAPIDALLEVSSTTPIRTTVIRKLVDRFPYSVPGEELVREVYGLKSCHKDAASLRVILNIMRSNLVEHGWTISRGSPGRGCKGEYRLMAAH